jgi:hypothetical protein
MEFKFTDYNKKKADYLKINTGSCSIVIEIPDDYSGNVLGIEYFQDSNKLLLAPLAKKVELNAFILPEGHKIAEAD